MVKVSGSQFANNALWKLFETVFTKLISLVISTILARLLSPDVYGVVALTAVFITFSDIFILNGFNVALIRKDVVTETDYSTVMVLSLVFTAIMYAVFFWSAPAIARFYETPELEQVLRSITVLLFFQSVSAVIRAKGTRELQFKKMSIVSLIGSTISSFVGLFMAYKGYGVWALVSQQVLMNAIDMILLAVVFKWRFSFKFSFKTAREMLSFTLGVLGASFLDFLGNNANGLVIGKAYNSTNLGYYNRGNSFPETISLNIYNSINSVLLPTLASRQNNADEMKQVVRKVVSLTEYIIMPMMFGLIAVSDTFVSFILTDKWMPCVPILVYGCLSYAMNPVRAIGYSVFYAKGESKRSVIIEIFRSAFMLLNLGITIVLLKKSIYVLSAMNVIIALLIVLITQYQVRLCIDYSFKDLFDDLLPTFLMCVTVVIIARLVTLLKIGSGLMLLIQIIAGVTTYISLSLLTRNANFLFVQNYITSKLKKSQKGL